MLIRNMLHKDYTINQKFCQLKLPLKYVVEFFRRDILAKKPEANTFYQKRLNKFLAQS